MCHDGDGVVDMVVWWLRMRKRWRDGISVELDLHMRLTRQCITAEHSSCGSISLNTYFCYPNLKSNTKYPS